MPGRAGRWLTGLMLVCLTGGGCAATSDAGSPSPDTSFTTFVQGISGARYADYAGRAGVAVRDEAAFEEMRAYLLERYGSAVALSSVSVAGAVFDCLRGNGSGATPPAPQPPPGGTDKATAAAASGPCPAGSAPVRRVGLDDLVRFETLNGFLGKGPPGGGLPPVSPR